MNEITVDILYVKKIWSTNPDKYKMMSFENARKSYTDYLLAHQRMNREWLWYSASASQPKSFKDWIETEI